MRIWMKAVAALLMLALLLWLMVKLGGFAVTILTSRDGGVSVQDPQFAEEMEKVTPPPELTGEEGVAVEFKDNSANWDISVQTPVDQTAAELEEEARTEN